MKTNKREMQIKTEAAKKKIARSMEMKNIMNRKNFIDKNGHKNNQKKVN